MKNIYNPQTIIEFKNRIEKIEESSVALWGKMNAYQMLKHCTENDKMLLREKGYKRLFIGRLFGKMALNSNIKNEEPLARNSPTHPDLKFDGSGDLEAQKREWINVLDRYPRSKPKFETTFIHPFFGKMTEVQISKFAFKHIDHHLSQFGV